MPNLQNHHLFEKGRKRRFKKVRNEQIVIEFLEGDENGARLRIDGLVVDVKRVQVRPIKVINAGAPRNGYC